jgi:hypothetical protein
VIPVNYEDFLKTFSPILKCACMSSFFIIEGIGRIFTQYNIREFTDVATSGRGLNRLFEINDCMKILSCIYFCMNLK